VLLLNLMVSFLYTPSPTHNLLIPPAVDLYYFCIWYLLYYGCRHHPWVGSTVFTDHIFFLVQLPFSSKLTTDFLYGPVKKSSQVFDRNKNIL
jgi:hypothetical protein